MNRRRPPSDRRQWFDEASTRPSGVAGDMIRTWQLTETEPDGNASPSAAADPRIRREAAVLAAMTMRTEEELSPNDLLPRRVGQVSLALGLTAYDQWLRDELSSTYCFASRPSVGRLRVTSMGVMKGTESANKAEPGIRPSSHSATRIQPLCVTRYTSSS